MNFKGFKKVGQDDHMATFRHEKTGHELRISRKNLSPKHQKALDELPMQKLADGGGVQGYSEQNDKPYDPSQRAEPPVSSPPPAAPIPSGASESPIVNAEPLPVDSGPGPANPPAPPQDQDPLGSAKATAAQIAALGEQKSGQQQVEQAKGELGQAQSRVEQSGQAQMSQNQRSYELANAELAKERIGLQQDIAQRHVDPNHFIDSMSTGKAIRTGIGLILGGMGSGLTGGPNLAFQFLQGQIDRDIEAQRAELGKKNNLLAHNIHAQGSLRAGVELTRIHTNDMVASQLRSEADKAQNAIAAGTMKNIAGLLDGSSAVLQHNLAIEKLQQAAFGGGSGNGPVSALAMETLPPEKRERAVQMPGGGLRLAITKEGAKEVREQLQSIQPIFSALDRLGSLGKAALWPKSDAAQSAESIRAQLIPLINENAGLKRLSSEDIGNIKEMFTDPTKFSSLFSNGKTAELKTFLQDKLVSTMNNQLEGMAPKRSYSAGHNFGFQPKKFLPHQR